MQNKNHWGRFLLIGMRGFAIQLVLLLAYFDHLKPSPWNDINQGRHFLYIS